MARIPKRGLGRGFEALLPGDFDKSLVLNEDERIQKIAINDIVPTADQPRRQFDEDGLKELADSIKSHGILLPLVITGSGKGKYQIVAGERRWRAAQLVGLKHVPAVIRSLKELERLEVSLIENIQRVDLSPLEQATTMRRLHEQFSTSYEEIAKRVGKATSTVNNIVRLLQLPPHVQAALNEHKISEGHARTLLSFSRDPEAQDHLLDMIVRHGWSVRQAERFVVSHREGIKETRAAHARVATETPLTRSLAKRLGTEVHVKRMAKGGRLEIQFSSDEELQTIIHRIQ